MTQSELNELRKQDMKLFFSKNGKKGGHARANSLTPEQRSAIAKAGAEAREARRRARKEKLPTGKV